MKTSWKKRKRLNPAKEARRREAEARHAKNQFRRAAISAWYAKKELDAAALERIAREP